MDKLAVLLPVYQHDNINYLQLSIESILSQTYNNFEILILIDGPVDNGFYELFDSFKSDKIHLIEFTINRGLAAVLNDGLKYCFQNNYEFIARMDADDISSPDRFEKQINYLKTHTEVDVLGGAIEEIDENGKTTGKVIKYPLTHEECYRFFSKRDPLAHPAVMFRKNFFEKAGLYNEKYRKNQDTQLWYQGFKNGCIFANLPEVILQFRVTSSFYQSRRGGWKRAAKMLSDRLVINKELNYGIKGNIFAFAMFLITISPTFLRKLAYKFFR